MSRKKFGSILASPRLLKIDEINIGDHPLLGSDDDCYHFLEFTSGAGYAGSRGNQLIMNLKKSPLRRGRREYRYKDRAIRECSTWMGDAVSDDWLRVGTLVPIPPSKSRDDREYDDRMVRVLNGIQKPFPVDVRELVVQTETVRAAHESPDDRPPVDELIAIYEIDESQAEPTPQGIAIVDDVLTAGVHYKAMHRVLSGRFPGVPVVGLFITRRVFSTAE